jgi:hypothetical protein
MDVRRFLKLSAIVISLESDGSAGAFLAPKPVIQVGSAESPALADMPPLNLALAGHLLERAGMNAQESGSFD